MAQHSPDLTGSVIVIQVSYFTSRSTKAAMFLDRLTANGALESLLYEHGMPHPEFVVRPDLVLERVFVPAIAVVVIGS